MTIQVPEKLTKHHGGKSLGDIGKKYAETYELWGGLKSTDTILDIGCGPGRMAIGIGERFGWTNNYTRFDISIADIEFCDKAITSQHPSFKFCHIDIENSHYNKDGQVSASSVRFPVADGSIDFVLASSIYTHFFSKEVLHYLKETARVCRGRTFSTWLIIDSKFEAGRKAGNARYDFPHIAEDGTYFQHPDRPLDAVGHKIEVIEQLHKDAGLKIVNVYPGAWTGQVKGRHNPDIIVAEVA